MSNVLKAIAFWFTTIYLMVALIVFFNELRQAERIGIVVIFEALITAISWVFRS